LNFYIKVKTLNNQTAMSETELKTLNSKVEKILDNQAEILTTINKVLAFMDTFGSNSSSTKSTEKKATRETINMFFKRSGVKFFHENGYLTKEQVNTIVKDSSDVWSSKKSDDTKEKAKAECIYKFLKEGSKKTKEGNVIFEKEDGKAILEKIRNDRDKADGIEPKGKRGTSKSPKKESKSNKKEAADSDSEADNQKAKKKKPAKSDDSDSDSDKPAAKSKSKAKAKKNDSDDEDSD